MERKIAPTPWVDLHTHTLTQRQEDEQAGVAILVVVAKKYHKRANKRNRIKRLIRESYRLNKHALQTLATERGLRIHLGLLSVAKELPDYNEVERGMLKALTKASSIIQGEEQEQEQRV